jgi:nifR3 family TIM-barrel protein
MNFWLQLRENKKPFFCVAPMADVTDAAFRRLIAKYGKPDVMWTEFVSANGLMSQGREVLQRDLEYSEEERPIVAQLFSADPEKIEAACALVAELGFDGVDLNMGCPDKTIEKQGAGAAMIKSPQAATAIIAAAKRGVQKAGKNIPVSVKTRVGYLTEELDSWIPHLLEQDIAALTVHARTRRDLSKVPAKWEYLKDVVELRDKISPHTVIIGNGDVISLEDGRIKAKESGCDGVMVGRALFGNPWFFDESRAITASLPKRRPKWIQRIPVIGSRFETKRAAPKSATTDLTVPERLRVMVEHTRLYVELLGDIKSFAIMKKHYKAYCTGFPGAKELRVELMEARGVEDVEAIVSAFLVQ